MESVKFYTYHYIYILDYSIINFIFSGFIITIALKYILCKDANF